jgi:ADP-ribose pyrophosphatase
MKKSDPPFKQADVSVEQRHTAYRDFLRLDKLQLKHRMFEGGWSEPIDRELLVKEQAVGVMLFDPDLDNLVMVRQFRVGMLGQQESPWPLELVAGLVDKPESLEEVAAREIYEETGLEASKLVKICQYFNSPGASTEYVTLYCCRVDSSEAGGIHGLDHEHEDIEVVVIAEAEAQEAVRTGAINNAMSVIALQWLALNKDALLHQWR